MRPPLIAFSACLLSAGVLFSQETAPLPTDDPASLSFGAVADKMLPSIVSILAPGTRAVPGAPLPSVGCGVAVSQDGQILTVQQALGNARSIEIAVRQEGAVRVYPARMLAVDDVTGAVLLKIDATLVPATLGSSASMRAGDAVFAGTVTGAHRTVIQGTVSGIGLQRERGRGAPRELVETNLTIAPEDSGSPLVDASGRLIGLNLVSAAGRGGRSLGFAIPVDAVRRLIEAPTQAPVAAASTQRGFLGVQVEDVPPAPTPPGIPAVPRGAVVQMIGGGSPAEVAGLQIGDVIVAVDGERIAESGRLRQILGARPAGAEVVIDVLRAGRPLTLTAVLTELPMEATAAPGPAPLPSPQPPMEAAPPVNAAPAEMLTGLTVNALTPQLRARTAAPVEVTGVVVTYVSPTSRALAMGVEEGDVITQVNRKPVSTPEEARQFAQEGDKTVLLKVYRKGDTMLFMVGR